MFSLEDSLLVNQWVQGVRSTADLLEWFEAASSDRKTEILRALVSLSQQARAKAEDAKEAIAASGLNPRRSACVVLSKGATTETMNKLSKLKSTDGKDAFLLLLQLLGLADTRRRSQEGDSVCHHWWHRDLSRTAVIDSIREDYANGRLGNT